jgi:uncharacterized membrane protein YkvA (DUF1232 family)
MPATRAKRSSTPRPLLNAEDFEHHLRVHAASIAPADVTTLVGQASALRARLAGERSVHPILAERAGVALQLLADHCHGACPQIPYSTVSLLATALYYYLAPMDVIPDFIPRAGTADDALVLDVAWRLAGPGIRRYLDARPTPPAAPASARGATKRVAPRPRAQARSTRGTSAGTRRPRS